MIDSMHKLFIEQLKDLYDAEHQLVRAMPHIADAAVNWELRELLKQQAHQARDHVARLEETFHSVEEQPGRRRCRAMKGLIAEAQELLIDDFETDILDAAIIASVQRIKHDEIAGYGCARAYAQILGDDKAAELLQKSLNEVNQADKSLTKVAMERVNQLAVRG